MARIEILNLQEIKQFNNPPIFNYQEKEYFFRLPKLIYDKVILFEDANAITQSAKNSSLRVQKELSFEQEPKKNNIIKSLGNINIGTLNMILQNKNLYHCKENYQDKLKDLNFKLASKKKMWYYEEMKSMEDIKINMIYQIK